MLSTESVWSRAGSDQRDEISAHLFNIVIGLTLLWGFAANYFIVQSLDPMWVMSLGMWPLMIGYIVCALAGTYIYTSSDSAMVSFLGYNLVVIPIGVILTPLMYSVDPQIIEKAILATGAVTSTMMLLGSTYPAFFLSIGRTLFIALIILIIVQVGMMFMGMHEPTWIDWIATGIFSGYIGFDWARANALPKTLDNAVDSAASLYIDIINLFIRLLSIMSKR